MGWCLSVRGLGGSAGKWPGFNLSSAVFLSVWVFYGVCGFAVQKRDIDFISFRQSTIVDGLKDFTVALIVIDKIIPPSFSK